MQQRPEFITPATEYTILASILGLDPHDGIKVRVHNTIILRGGQRMFNQHHACDCQGKSCCIHRPSNHSMRSFPQNWRPDRGIMERICPHGVGHPDPDDPTTDRVHGCCVEACCYRGPRFDDNAGHGIRICKIED